MRSRIVAAVLLGGGVAICNAAVYAFSPRPHQISGNGFNLPQLAACLLSLALALGLVAVLASLGHRLAARLPQRLRAAAAAAALAAAAVLVALAWQSFRAFEAGTAYYRRWGPDHGWGLINQYTVAYWAAARPFWAGVALGALGLGALFPRRGPVPPAGPGARGQRGGMAKEGAR